ncbi:hypothetical protein Ssi03_76300 [Sphaerisporangium siamense]|uniref:Uncharacterized protein n=1 Tax=Sphaerisporangium siamense TaxID=795645 RepID=A0A7W7G9U5_9ACTN|nr:hypothetical protein [Sphaerisporangium siamense]MBB4699311.1 hypothetical protein [Sphaerisporangium siamense]GII89640.1 hypothetical protein Ssi03_76300 [Sphaerisporangium siamense]
MTNMGEFRWNFDDLGDLDPHRVQDFVQTLKAVTENAYLQVSGRPKEEVVQTLRREWNRQSFDRFPTRIMERLAEPISQGVKPVFKRE